MMEKPVSMDAKVDDAIIECATLRGIWMIDSRFEMAPQALEPDGGAITYTLRPFDPEVTIDEDGVVNGFIRFEASSRRKRRRLILVSARYFLSYRIEGGCDQPTAELFIDRVGKLTAYPYFRALVGSLAAQAGAPIPALPIVSFQPRNIRSAAATADA